MDILKRKTLSEITNDRRNSQLKKTLGSFDLFLLGIGSIVGGGVFVLNGLVSSEYTGPAIIISYALAGASALMLALCYIELTTTVPTSAAIYNYSYNVFGEVFAWMGFWIVLLEFATAASSVAVGWSAYVSSLLGFIVPAALLKSPFEGGYFNLIAVVLVLFLAIVLLLGVNLSKKLNNALVILKFITIFAFIIFSLKFFKIENLQDFMPFGIQGVLNGTALLFFSFNGYSMLASSVEECTNPVRNLYIGLICSVLTALLIYVLVALLLNAAVHYKELKNILNPLSFVFRKYQISFMSNFMLAGVAISIITGVLSNMYAISRIIYNVARDKLLPQSFMKLHNMVPSFAIIITGILVLALAGFFPIKVLGHLSSISSLLNALIMLIIFTIFRIKHPNLKRIIKIPFAFLLVPIAFCAMAYLLIIQFFTDHDSIIYLIFMLIWLLVGIIVYFINKDCSD